MCIWGGLSQSKCLFPRHARCLSGGLFRCSRSPRAGFLLVLRFTALSGERPGLQDPLTVPLDQGCPSCLACSLKTLASHIVRSLPRLGAEASPGPVTPTSWSRGPWQACVQAGDRVMSAPSWAWPALTCPPGPLAGRRTSPAVLPTVGSAVPILSPWHPSWSSHVPWSSWSPRLDPVSQALGLNLSADSRDTPNPGVMVARLLLTPSVSGMSTASATLGVFSFFF